MIATKREFTTVKADAGAYQEIADLPAGAIIPKTITSGLQGIITGIYCREKHILCHRKFGVIKDYNVSDDSEEIKKEMLQFCCDFKRALISSPENFDKLCRKLCSREGEALHDFRKSKRFLSKYRYEDSPDYPVYFERKAPEFKVLHAEDSDRIIGYKISFRCSIIFLKSKDDAQFLIVKIELQPHERA